MASGGLVLCFGEALWDIFPGETRPGGAPLNVAYHLSKLGYRAAPVTAIGDDDLGAKLLDQMTSWGLDTRFVTKAPDRPTGTVKVVLTDDGQPTYGIDEDSAWQRISIDEDALETAAGASAIVFGTLALGLLHNREQFARLQAVCTAALKIYDVNLRPPYTAADIVWAVAEHADIIKLTREELEVLLPTAAADTEARASRLAELTGCEKICVTDGDAGAWLLHGSKWHHASGRPAEVADAVGAGDAFLAALSDALLSGLAPQQALENGCRMGEFIVARHGATPTYNNADLRSIGVR